MSGYLQLLNTQQSVAIHEWFGDIATNICIDLVLIAVVSNNIQVFHKIVLLVGAQVLFMELIDPIPEHIGVACLIPWPKLLIDL